MRLDPLPIILALYLTRPSIHSRCKVCQACDPTARLHRHIHSKATEMPGSDCLFKGDDELLLLLVLAVDDDILLSEMDLDACSRQF